MLRAQVGLEYAAIIILLLVVLIPLVYLGFRDIQTASQVSRTKIAVDAIADAANRVYAQGPGARTTIEIFLPDGINSVSITGKEVNYNVILPGGGTTDVFALAKGNLSGTLPMSVGRHLLILDMNSSGVVVVSETT